MNSRDRIRKALNHQEPDQVPVDLGGYQSGISYETFIPIKKKLNIDSPTTIAEPIQGLARVDEEVLQLFHVDTRYIFPQSPAGWDGTVEEDGYFTDRWGLKWRHSFYDEFGIKWHRPSSSHYYDMVARKLSGASVEDLDSYSWPDPDTPGRTKGLEEKVKRLYDETDYAIFTSGSGVFENSWQCYGMEDYFLATIDDIAFIKKLLDKMLEALAGLYEKFLSVAGPYLECIELYSDLGTQQGPLISPKFYREFVKPRDMELISTLKKKTNAKICMHSCGSVYDFIPDIIDAGYEVINPVQTTAVNMEAKRLKREFGKDLVFWGAIDTQRVLPFGTTQDVESEVMEKICEFGKGGGYILAPCHNIQAKTPAVNVLEMFEAAHEYGRYPLDICEK